MNHLKISGLFLLLILITACKVSVSDKRSNGQTENPTMDSQPLNTHNIPWSTIQSLGKIPFDYWIPYGPEEPQFGELSVPEEGKGPFPIVVFIHGGCWLSAYNLDYLSAVCRDLVNEGFAVWAPEYRRVGDEGGGYPNTFADVQKSLEHLRELAQMYPIDAQNIILMGHSAGGHLALWLANQKNLSPNHPLFQKNPLPIKGVIALAGITDLASYDKVGNDCSSAVARLMGGKPEELSQQYRENSPVFTVPNHIPTRLIHGDRDNIVPIAQSETYADAASKNGDDVRVVRIEGGGHFDMVYPHSAAWQTIKQEVKSLFLKK